MQKIVLIIMSLCCFLKAAEEQTYQGKEKRPKVVTTFASAGIYWKPTGGGPEYPCTVRYRKAGDKDWREAMDLWCDPNEQHEAAAFRQFEYRGSIVHLQSGTEYEAELSIEKLKLKRNIKFTTMSEDFKIARKVVLPATVDTTYEILEGGSPETGYVLYEAPAGTVWDADNKIYEQVLIKTSWVIVRGLKLKNARRHGIELLDVNHVVIEDCEISGWGTNDPRDGYGIDFHSAIFSDSREVKNIIIQNCDLHHPRSDSNSWRERNIRGSRHPRGPQGISFMWPKGHFIIRNNKIYSDLDHMFNDGIGGTNNFSYGGFPVRDSDIYDNFVSHCWDDALEIEGADMNVRVWNNYIDWSWGAIGAASPSLGPVYFWRNVYAVSRAGRTMDSSGYRGHYLVKLGNEKLNWVRGKMYIFHNTALQPPPYGGRKRTCGAQSGIIFTSKKKRAHNITSRNNILQMRYSDNHAILDRQHTLTNDFDYDMIFGRITGKKGTEAHAIWEQPTYERAKDGRLWLKPGTAGYDAAVRIPNFNDDYTGKGPDMGAVETNSKTEKPKVWPDFPDNVKVVEKNNEQAFKTKKEKK